MEGKKMCQRYLTLPYLNLRLVHTYLDIFEKKGEKRRTVK